MIIPYMISLISVIIWNQAITVINTIIVVGIFSHSIMASFNLFTILVVAIPLSLYIFHTPTQAIEDDSEQVTMMGQHIGGITMNIYYCYSCGYKKAFDDYAGIIQQKYPEISVIGGNYDPPGFNMHLSRLIGLGKIVIIMCILRGVNILGFLNKPQPSWWTWCVENKVYACMMLFFLANMIEGQLVSSGAFEISLNNIPLWSKLETGRIPQPPELFQIIDNTLAFTKSDNINANFIN